MQPVQNSIPAVNADLATPANTSPASVVLSLPSAALYAPSLTPLYSTASLAPNSAVAQQPMPFQVSPAQSGLAANQSQLVSSLDTASVGLGGLLNSLDTSGTATQVNNLLQDAETVATSGDGLTAQKDMAQAQLLYTTMSTLLNMITQMQEDAIKNSRVS